MRRVCFIGNSHVGSVKRAADEIKDSGVLDGVDVTIFGSHRDSLKTLKIRDGYLVSDDDFVQKNFHWTSGGSTKVKISEYDEICFILGRSIFDFTKFQAGTDIPFISNNLAMKLVNAALNTWPMRLAMRTAKESDNVQVTHVGRPFVSAEAPLSKAILARFSEPESKISSRTEQLRTLMDEKSTEVSEGNFRFMKPPTATLEEHGLFTQHIFCQGSIRLGKKMNKSHSTDDYGHMNADYGRLILEHLLAQTA
ncbi:hypothetical protein [Rhodalgimonas zhirmunskyi]|uniref:Uncharacterized protein n=1 Tax=Rhodalgimonas zhirmunskyi TaxID=2964767 RepID=A0AAJ1X4K6_9RHOB|nr:hypothetical protein [Rhodoalgimonas zhirmunskyi]MDQ2094358.1 hypothetical protein [Rhodoalgimonas zhirmunskyi]